MERIDVKCSHRKRCPTASGRFLLLGCAKGEDDPVYHWGVVVRTFSNSCLQNLAWLVVP